MARYLDRLLKLRQLRIVSALGNYGSVSGAARALSLSQPALTKALQELEKTVGSQVYERHAKGVQATPAGHAVIETSRRILAQLARLDEELDRIENRTAASVAVGAAPAPAVGLLPQVLALLRRGSSDLQMRVIEGGYEDLGPALSAGEIDLIVGRLYDTPAPDSFVREVLYNDPVVLLARVGHPLFRGELTIENVEEYELIVPPVSRRFGQEVDQLLARLANFRPTLLRSTSIGFAREMVHATDTIAFAPRLTMAADVLRGTVCVVPLDLGLPPRPSGITYRNDSPLQGGARVFIEGLKTTIRSMPW